MDRFVECLRVPLSDGNWISVASTKPLTPADMDILAEYLAVMARAVGRTHAGPLPAPGKGKTTP